jgi:hypothetical protein
MERCILNDYKPCEICCFAIAGELRVEVTGPNGNVPVDVVSRDTDLYLVTFLPNAPGLHFSQLRCRNYLRNKRFKLLASGNFLFARLF